jgi:hypothetical protein
MAFSSPMTTVEPCGDQNSLPCPVPDIWSILHTGGLLDGFGADGSLIGAWGGISASSTISGGSNGSAKQETLEAKL